MNLDDAEDAASNIGQSTVSGLQSFQGSRVLWCPTTKNSICTMGDEIVSVDPKTGERRWQLKLDGDLKKLGGTLGAAPSMAAQFGAS